MKSMVMRTSIAPGQSVAVIGSGISGLASAWFLGQKHRVTLFEKNAKLGGHTNTCSLQLEGVEQSVDTGFIVYNRPNYPHLNAMLKHLKVPIENTEMSFSVSVDQGRIEYSGNNLNTLFAQRRNLLSVAHWKMLAEILRFNRQAKKDLFNDRLRAMTLEDYLREHHFSLRMRDYYLLPMAAAIWSCPVKTMMAFPAESFLRFFENHGLLNIQDRPQWETVKGGAQNYIDALMQKAKFSVAYDPVRRVAKTADGLKVTTENGEAFFDHVVFAAHGDQNWQLFDRNLQQTFTCMQAFKYQKNSAYLHSDTRLMPRRKNAWASWNYLRESCSEEHQVAVTYWMNRLQNISLKTPVLVTLNPLQEPAEHKTYQRIQYEHPVFDRDATDAQKSLTGSQGVDNCWFVGAYTGYGFHEDGLRSAVDLARRWNVSLPWENGGGEV